jgi:hypothetical protein
MLPDFPLLKKDVSIPLLEFLARRRDFYLGPLARMRQSALFEGEGQRIGRESGVFEDSETWSLHATFELTPEELETMTLEKILVRLNSMAKDLAGQMAKNFYGAMRRTTEKTGQVVDGSHREISADIIMEMFDKLDFDFDRNGQPLMPELHIPPNLENKLRSVLEDAQNNEELRSRFESLIERKKGDWLAREASRKLVG